MEITGGWMIFLFGCFGGMAVELLRWWKLRESLEFPVYTRKPAYWLLTILMILAGGGIAVAYGVEKSTAILSMNIGASAPAIFGALLTKPKDLLPDGPSERKFGGSDTTLTRLRRFLAFGR